MEKPTIEKDPISATVYIAPDGKVNSWAGADRPADPIIVVRSAVDNEPDAFNMFTDRLKSTLYDLTLESPDASQQEVADELTEKGFSAYVSEPQIDE